MFERFDRFAGGFVLTGAVLLFVDLFLDWRKLTVDVPLVHVSTGSSGWASWGVVAGILVLCLIVWETVSLLVRRSAPDIPSAFLAVGTLVFVLIRFFEDATNVSIATTVSVGEGARQWPAYVGVVLAVAIAAAALARVVPHGAHHGKAVPA
jgi:hypothetical protein